MDKAKSKILIFGLLSIAIVLSAYFVFAAFTIADSISPITMNTSSSTILNLTVTNQDAESNVTQVNITLPSGFLYATDSSGTSSAGSTGFSNTSNVLTWTSSTNNLIANGSSVDEYFWFNVSTSTSGLYNNLNWVYAFNGSDWALGPVIASFTVTDTTPPLVYFGDRSTAAGNATNSSITVNVTGSDNNIVKNWTMALYDSAWALVTGIGQNPVSNTVTSSSFSAMQSFEGLLNITYNVNLTAYDDAGNVNQTTREIILNYTDDENPLINFTAPTYTDAGYYSTTYIISNLTVSDAYLKNVTTYLYNDTNGATLVNKDWVGGCMGVGMDCFYKMFNGSIGNEDSGLPEGAYYLNATAYDTVGHMNSTETRTVVLDRTNPIINLNSPPNGATPNSFEMTFNCSATDTVELKSITLWIWNVTDTAINTTTSLVSGFSNEFTTNVTIPYDGNFKWNCKAEDIAGNSVFNSTNRTFTMITDVSPPVVTLITPPSGSLQNTNVTSHSFNVTDASGPANCTMYWTTGAGVQNFAPVPVNGTTFNAGNIIDSPEGTTFWYVNCTDAVGLNGTSNVWNFTTDTQAPVINFTNIANGTVIGELALPYLIMGGVSDNMIGVSNVSFTVINAGDSLHSANSNPPVWNYSWGPGDGVWNITAIACDLANNCANSSIYNIIIDQVTPQFVGQAEVLNPDVFFSVFDSIANVAVNLTETTGLTVKANFSNMSTTLNCATGGSGSDSMLTLVYNSVLGLYNSTCNITSAASGISNVTQGLIVISAVDQVPSHVNITTVPILLHNMDVPQGPPSGCTRFGSDTTNFTEEMDFSNINFMIDTEANFSCIAAPLTGFSPEYQDVNLINLTHVDISNQTKAMKLRQLPQNLQVNISGPRSFTTSRIYINSSFFEELNTSAVVNFYNLPFSTMPDVTAEAGAAGLNNSVIPVWDLNGYGSEFHTVTGNLTFTVLGFSGYVVDEYDNPLMTVMSPATTSTSSSVLVSVIFNGTGSDMSFVNITNMSGGADYIYDERVQGQPTNSAQCANMTESSTMLNCTVMMTNVPQGSRTLTITAADWGNKTVFGNINTTTVTVLVDTVKPSLSLTSPANNASSTVNAVAFTFNADDTNKDACNFYFDGNESVWEDVNDSVVTLPYNQVIGVRNWSAVINVTGIPEGLHNWTVQCYDGVGNDNRSETRFLTVDTVAPQLVLNGPVNGYNTSSFARINFTATDNLSTNLNCTYRMGSSADNVLVTSGVEYSTTISIGAEGTYAWNVTCSDTAGNANLSQNRYVAFDYAAPVCSVISISPSSPVAYVPNAAYYFNVTCNDSTTSVDKVMLNFNGAKVMTQNGVNYNYTITDLPAGVTAFNITANDTLGNGNGVPFHASTYNVSLASPSLSIVNYTSLNVSFGNTTIVNGSGCNSQITCVLFRAGNQVGSGSTGEQAVLAAGTHTYTYNTSGNENYSSTSATPVNLVVNQLAPTLTVYLNNTANEYHDVAQNNYLLMNATTSITSCGSIGLYVGGVLQNSGTNIYNNTYNFTTVSTVNVTALFGGNDNCSASSDTKWVNVIGSNVYTPANVTVNTTLYNQTDPVSISFTSNLTSDGNATVADTIVLSRAGTSINFTVEINDSTIISGGASWNGQLEVPTVNASSFGVTSGTVDIAVDMGSSVELNFSQPVMINISGVGTGKKAGWSRGSTTITPITLCSNLSNPTATISSNGTTRECYGNSGNDVIIWTYHFTTFAAYTSTTATATPASSPSSAGGCFTEWKCSDWSACTDGMQTRTCSKAVSYCYADSKKMPALNQTCTVTPTAETTTTPTTAEKITEEVKEVVGGMNWPAVGIGALVIVIAAIIYFVVRPKKAEHLHHHAHH